MTFLRWAGSKKQLGPVLANCWFAAQAAGGSGRYFEAFCGSASLFFRLRPRSAVLIDVNADLIGCFRAVKSKPKEVAKRLSEFPIGSKHYYRLRKKTSTDGTDVDKASRFIYLNRFSFNGLYRTNAQGQFNVPFGGGKSGSLPDSKLLIESSRLLNKASLVQGDFFSEVITRINPGDFIYLDPPYAIPNHSLDYQYGPDVFGVHDLGRLFELLNHIDRLGAFFVLSYANCPLIRKFNRYWKGHEVEVKRYIAANSDNRQKVKELLIANY